MASASIGSNAGRPAQTVVHQIDTDTYETLTLPGWTRVVNLRNQGSVTVYVGIGVSGTPGPGTGYELDPGEDVTLRVTGGQSRKTSPAVLAGCPTGATNTPYVAVILEAGA